MQRLNRNTNSKTPVSDSTVTKNPLDTQDAPQEPGSASLLEGSFHNPPALQLTQESLDAMDSSDMYELLSQYIIPRQASQSRQRSQGATKNAAVDRSESSEQWGGKLASTDSSTPRRPELAK